MRFDHRTIDDPPPCGRLFVCEPVDVVGDGLRVAYLLAADAPPADPTAENAYRSVHVRVDVEESGAAATGA